MSPLDTLLCWIRGLFVKLPPTADHAAIRTAEECLTAKIAAIKAAEEEKRRIAAEKLRIEAERRRKEEERRRREAADNPHVAESGPRYSIESRESGGGSRWSITAMPGRLFDDDDESASVSAQISAKAAGKKTFSEELLSLVRVKCDGNAPMAYKRAGISRQSYSRIISSTYSGIDKLTAMRLCIGLQLTWDESVALLKAAGYAFSEAIPMDCIFLHCIQNGIWNIFDVNRIVEKCRQRTFDIVF